MYLFKKNINFASTYLTLPSRFNLKFPSSMKHSVSFLILNVNFYLWKGHTTLMMTLLLLFIHSSVDGHLGRVHSLVIMNNGTVIIYVQDFTYIYILNSTDECIKQMRYIHTMGYYLTIKGWIFDICYNTDKPWKYYILSQKCQKNKNSNTYDSTYRKISRRAKFRVTESR